MSKAQAESVIKNIIREIVQECAGKGQAVSETLVAFMVKAVVLDPKNEFNVDRTLTKDDVQKLIRICVDRLLNVHSPSLDTIKMQVYFDMNYTSRSDFLEEHRRVRESRLQPVIREITDSRAKTRDELESLYRKIVSAVLLRSGLGSPTDIGVVREATAALQSVFPPTELGTFMSLIKRDKERQLQELTMIVTGIRLFNKECGKGGEGIDDLPGILNDAVPAVSRNIDFELQQTLNFAHKYTAAVEKLFNSASIGNNDPNMISLKESLINCRQCETFLGILKNDLVGSAQLVQSMEEQLASHLQQLQSAVQSKTAVPTAQVYPLFIQLSQVWTGFQDEMVLLSVLSNILASLEPFTRAHRELFPEETLRSILEDSPIPTDDDRRISASKDRVVPEQPGKKETGTKQQPPPRHDWLFPDSTGIDRFDESIPLQYHGYCGWSLVKNDRFLLPGYPSIGVLRRDGFYYAFSSAKAAQEFAADFDRNVSLVSEVAKSSPELIQLLQLHRGQFSAVSGFAEKGEKKPPRGAKIDGETQTPTHFMETNIIKSYEWNEWALRQKAIKLTNLRRKLTHAAQTELSNMRRDNAVQCYPPRDAEVQTRTDGSSNVPKPQTFQAGLRGCGIGQPTEFAKIDLTRDVNE